MIRAIAGFLKRDWDLTEERSIRRSESRSVRRRKKWADRAQHCCRCWYDLSGAPADICPECGTPTSHAESIWTDGRWSLEVLIALWIGLWIASIVFGLVYSRMPDPPLTIAHAIMTACIGFLGLSAFWGGFASVVVAGQYCTRRRHQQIRVGTALAVWAVVFTLLGFLG